MPRFDWEPRPQPEGYLQILRNQKREASDRELKQFTDVYKTQKYRAQWEDTLDKRAELAAQRRLALGGGESGCDSIGEHSPQPRPCIAEELRREEQEKKAAKEAVKAAAARRKAALLEHAAALAAEKEAQRLARIKETEEKLLEKQYPELAKCASVARYEELAGVWDQQRAEKLAAAQQEQEESKAAIQGPIGFSKLDGDSEMRLKQMKEQVRRNLEQQMDEAEARRAAERLHVAATEAQMKEAYEKAQMAEYEQAQQRRQEQKEFFEDMEKVRAWRQEEVARRAAALAEEGQRYVAETAKMLEEADLGDIAAKEQRRLEAEAQLDEFLDARASDLAAKSKADQEYLSQLEALLQRRDAEMATKQAQQQHRLQEAIATNGKLVEAQHAQQQQQITEKLLEKSRAERLVAEMAEEEAQMKNKKSVEAAKCRAELGAQITAKQVRAATEELVIKQSQQNEIEKEKERQKYVAQVLQRMQNN